MTKERKSRAFNSSDVSLRQRILSGFEHLFNRELDPSNRWIILSCLIPWDELCSLYYKETGRHTAGRKALNPRIILDSLSIRYFCELDDRETVYRISENIYMQYFLGYSSFTSDKPFDTSLFGDIRKRLGMDCMNAINEKIVQLKTRFEDKSGRKNEPSAEVSQTDEDLPVDSKEDVSDPPSEEIHKGLLLPDTTVYPQDIVYPADLDLLSEAREISERLIDSLYDKHLHREKSRTYRQVARKEYLQTAQKKKKTKNAVRKQLGYPGCNIRSIHHLLDFYPAVVLADMIYCTRDNRKMLKGKGSGNLLGGQPLGRPSVSAVSIHVSPGERNPIEGKFDQARTEYGLNRIKARSKQSCESWIAGLFLVFNLLKLAEAAVSCRVMKVLRHFSTKMIEETGSLLTLYRGNIRRHSYAMTAVA